MRAKGDDYYLDPRVAQAYDADHEGSDITREDLPFYLHLAKQAWGSGESVLDLACGTGRVALPIAGEGIRVVGLDRSPAMLEIAKSKSTVTSNPDWIEADMTDFQLRERFGLVIIAFRSFMHLMTVAEQKACLQSVKAHLVEGGRLALNFLNPRILSAVKHLTTSQYVSPLWSTAERVDENLPVERGLHESNALISRIHRGQRVRYIFREEMESLLANTGFEVEALYGWFDHEPFHEESSELVWIARNVP